MEEETGYQSNIWQQIGVVDANPAIQTNKCFTFLAKDISPSGQINLDPDEMIDYTLVEYEKVKEFITDGKITNTYIIAAFYWYDLLIFVK